MAFLKLSDIVKESRVVPSPKSDIQIASNRLYRRWKRKMNSKSDLVEMSSWWQNNRPYCYFLEKQYIVFSIYECKERRNRNEAIKIVKRLAEQYGDSILIPITTPTEISESYVIWREANTTYG